MKQESYFYWLKNPDPETKYWVGDYGWYQDKEPYIGENFASAFTVAELGEMLPRSTSR